MKKKFCIVTVLLFTLALCACSGAGQPSDDAAAYLPDASGPAEQDAPQAAGCVFDSNLFGGKLRGCAYAGEGKLFVAADKLYLYDTAAASVLATAEAPLQDFDAQTIDGGYLLSGWGDDGIMAYIYDSALSLKKELAVNELLAGDIVASETCGVAVSSDGKKLAFAALGGLYLYDLESGHLSTLLDVAQNAGTAGIVLSMLNGAAFSQYNSQILFCGDGRSVPEVNGEGSFFVCGSIAVDGSNLKLTKPSAYDGIEEMQSSAGRLFFPPAVNQANGSVVWMDRTTGGVNTLSFSADSEGADGVYCSEQGNYVATATLGGSLTVRVYDVDSGTLIATEVIENPDSTYFNRIPRIYLLDGAKTAVVILGGSINEVDTLASTFTFGE